VDQADAEPEGAPKKKKKKKKRSWKRMAIEVAVVALVFFGIRAWQQRDAPTGPAPALSAYDLSGAPVELGASDEPVVVHFWATWCGVCEAENGTIDALADDHRVITIAAQSGPPSQVAAYLEERGLDFPVVNDPGSEITHRWGVHAFPTTFVVDGDGQIRSTEVGYTTGWGLRARLWLARL